MPQLPFTRRQALIGVVALATVLVLAGRLIAQPEARVEQPAAATVVAEAPPEPPRLVVHVVGAVRNPGLYRLDEGSRVADALALAGGAGEKADLAAVNLAAPLADGTQVVVPRRGEAAAGVAAEPGRPAAAAGPLRLSTATLAELDALPGVGPVTAQRIVDYREAHGPFRSVDELDAVPGIGPARLEQLRELVAP